MLCGSILSLDSIPFFQCSGYMERVDVLLEMGNRMRRSLVTRLTQKLSRLLGRRIQRL